MTKNSNLTIKEVYDRYRATLDKPEAGGLQTALLRFTTPGLKGGKYEKRRLNQAMIDAALDVLSRTPVEKLKDAVEIQAGVMAKAKVSDGSRRLHKHHLKGFVDWAIGQRFIQIEEVSEQRELRSLKHPVKERSELKKWWNGKDPYTLTAEELAQNPNLQAELDEFAQREQEELHKSQYSVNPYIGEILRFLGWLHRIRGKALESLSLQTIVRHVPLRHDDPVDEVKAERECGRAADEMARLLTDYFLWRKVKAVSNVQTAKAILNVAKYLYRNDVSRRKGYDSVPVVAEIRAIIKDEGKEAKMEPKREKHMISMAEYDHALLELKKDADQKHTDTRCKSGRDVGRIRRRERPPTAIANSLQNFLLVGFLSATPPQRQRVLREMEIGKHLVRGEIRDDGSFVPQDRMEDPSKAGWVLDLDAGIQKTKVAMRLPVWNIPFPDGTCFYDYIDRWLSGERALFEPTHNCFFTKTQRPAKGASMDKSAVYQRVTTAFHAHADTPMNPHAFRNVVITHARRSGATREQLEALARAMGHSIEMQDKVYNQQSDQERMAPAFKLVQSFSSFEDSKSA